MCSGVPVAYAAELLRQACGGRRDDRSGGRVREQLKRERRAMNHLAPAPAVARAAQPTPPERHSRVELGGDVDIATRSRHLIWLDAVQHEGRRLPGSNGEVRADVAAVDHLQRAARRQAQLERRRAEQRAVLSERDLVACAGVVEARGDVDDETHMTAHGYHPANDAVTTCRLAATRRHEVLHLPTPSGIRKRVMRMLVSGR